MPSLAPVHPPCNFCGIHARGVTWYGHSTIHCCRKCVEEVLPVIMAVSLPLTQNSIYHSADAEWNGRFKVRFLRALLARCQPKTGTS